jgi:putative transposase
MSERHVCGLALIAVSSYRYPARRSAHDAGLRAQLTQLAQQHPRYGYRRLCVLVRRTGEAANHKRVHQLYREAGLSLRRQKRKHLARQRGVFQMFQSRNEEWALDFVSDALASNRHLRILSVVDVFTRQCLALETDTSLGSARVIRVLEQIITERGAPQRIARIMARSSPAVASSHGAWTGTSNWSTSDPASRWGTRTWKVSMAGCANSVCK